MPPATEPSSQDIEAVANAIGEQPTVQPAPQQPEPQQPQQPAAQPQQPTQQQPAQQPAQQPQQPAQPTNQPLDPFAAFAAQPPAQPAQPTQPEPQQPQPSQPEPTPTPQPQQPAEPSQAAPEPQAPAEPQTQPEQYQSYEEYIKSVIGDTGNEPESPDPSKISPDDPEAIKQFFDDLVNTAVTKATQETAKKAAIQSHERQLWDGAFDKYPSLKSNKNLRDMVHSIRMGHFQRGQAITPTQAADKLLESLGQQYKQGVADSQVQTTIEQVQPQGGGTGNPVATTLDKNDALLAVQDGGEQALTEILDQEIKAGRL